MCYTSFGKLGRESPCDKGVIEKMKNFSEHIHQLKKQKASSCFAQFYVQAEENEETDAEPSYTAPCLDDAELELYGFGRRDSRKSDSCKRGRLLPGMYGCIEASEQDTERGFLQ